MPYKKLFIGLLLSCIAICVATVILSDSIFTYSNGVINADGALQAQHMQMQETQSQISQSVNTNIQYDEIIKIQKRLIELDYLEDDKFTGEYDIDTVLAVMKLQGHYSLLQSGICDEDTEKILFSADTEQMSEREFALLAPTTRMEFEELVGDNGIYEYPSGYPKAGTYKITVDIAHQVVMVHKKDADGEYTVPVRYMLCSSGARGHTPTGTFEMKSYRVRFGKFVNDGVYGQYWSQIYKAFYFHTILYSKKDASTYTETSYNNLGKAVSHGCVRLTVPDARWIWYNIAPGTVCEIRKGDKKDEETAAIREKLVLAKAPSTRPALRKGEIPYTDVWTVEEIPLEIPFVQGSQD